MLTLLFLLKPCLILDLGRLEIFKGFHIQNLIAKYSKAKNCMVKLKFAITIQIFYILKIQERIVSLEIWYLKNPGKIHVT